MVRKIKSAWNKNNFREIKHTIGRYIAILSIVALGVGFFSGLKVCQEAMLQTGGKYVDELNLFDYRLVSTLGFEEPDAQYFRDLSYIDEAETSIYFDFITDSLSENGKVMRAHSLTENINKLSLIYGRFPKENNELVADSRMFSINDIGKTIKISDENTEDTKEKFLNREYRIVGIANSPYYLSFERGTTRLGDGSIAAFVYIPKQGFVTDYYSEIFVTLKNKGKSYTSEYDDKIDEKEIEVKSDLESNADSRYESIITKANEEIRRYEDEYNDSYNQYQSKKIETEAQLNEALKELNSAKEKIEDTEQELNSGTEQIKKAKLDYENGHIEYLSSRAEFNVTKQMTLKSVEILQSVLDESRADTIAELENLVGKEDSDEYKILEETLVGIEKTQQRLDEKKEKVNIEFAQAEAQLEYANDVLIKSKYKIDDTEKQLESGYAALEEAKDQYAIGLEEYNASKEKAEEEFKNAEIQLEEAKNKIEESKNEVDKIQNPTTYVFDRSYNSGYSGFKDNASLVDGIAKIFPIFFFLVAALVCMTTMTRMLEEQRTQIGTFKALGYSNSTIIMKYIAYAGSSAVLGCTIGFFLGSWIFPYTIWRAYGLIYSDFASIEYVLDWKIAVMVLSVSLLCSVGVTFLACKNELLRMPAELMRPKAPKAGKRIFLEKIPFIWNRLSFLHKVTARNVLRFKKRLIMMILGIGGCTALVLTGFGVGDSIKNVVSDQFNNIMKYDYNIYFSEAKNSDSIAQFKSENKDKLTECVFVCSDTIEVYDKNGKTNSAYTVATDDMNILNIVGMHMKDKEVEFPANGTVAINDRLADMANISLGDKISIKINDIETKEVEVSGIFENYVYNYIIMTSDTYTQIFDKECEYKNALASTDNENIYSLSTEIAKQDGVSNVVVSDEIRTNADNMLVSLNYVVWLVIICAGSLAFVVLYNLSNINITERIREIATIKVLGFLPSETHSYVFRENIVLTILGVIVGIPSGILLHSFVMNEVQVDFVSFNVRILPLSFLFTILITFSLTFLVELVMRRKIDKIEMVESLKSVE